MVSPVNARLFVQRLVYTNMKENITAPHYCPLWGPGALTRDNNAAHCWRGSTGFTSQRASNAESVSMSWRHHHFQQRTCEYADGFLAVWRQCYMEWGLSLVVPQSEVRTGSDQKPQQFRSLAIGGQVAGGLLSVRLCIQICSLWDQKPARRTTNTI